MIGENEWYNSSYVVDLSRIEEEAKFTSKIKTEIQPLPYPIIGPNVISIADQSGDAILFVAGVIKEDDVYKTAIFAYHRELPQNAHQWTKIELGIFED